MQEPFIGMKISMEKPLSDYPIAMAYTPLQQWKTTYSPEEGLMVGTIFPELNLPFVGCKKTTISPNCLKPSNPSNSCKGGCK